MTCRFCNTIIHEYTDDSGFTDDNGSVWTSYRGDYFIADNSNNGRACISRLMSSNGCQEGIAIVVDDIVIPARYCLHCGANLDGGGE